jgi:hypothetical protein
MSSPNTDSTALPLPANFLAAQSTIDDFFVAANTAASQAS